ncbi:hypothetical protein GOEFS_091_00460 [Gordonia effusa NBRC 100432]|uniref:Uncharacterized protein n=1 Tax=Gordonia effusa NBRC 100432 TaxID=1077974 RepID=H0R3A2_9ACTN|nr:hypothetical protein GOEFS_091_00460 [Gordonia effusa NBRC 100432]
MRRLMILIVAVAMPTLSMTAPASGAPQGYAPPPGCAWQLMSNSSDLNVAFPDANATYWILPYLLGGGDSISLSGTYPTARYFSLNTYGTDFNTVDTLRDNQIHPVSGGNPYASTAAASSLGNGKWKATVVNRPANHARNEIRGLPAAGKQRIPLGFLIIRVYVPHNPTSANGGVTLPDVTMHLGGTAVHLPPCAVPFNPRNYRGPIAEALTSVFDKAIGNAAANSFPANSPEATFVNPASTAGLFPNGDNKYIGAALTYRPGRVAVVRGKAPTYPNTRAGASPAQPGVDLRYWSMCQNDKVSPYPVVACAADFQTRLDADGYYTYVVAVQQDMASSSNPALTVIPWGSTSVPKKVVFLRYMLPSSAFYPQTVQAEQANRTDPASTMGAYYPRATYCDVTVLRNRGWQACFG